MQQGKAKEFEDTVRDEKAGVPLNMEVAVGGGGLAVLKGYRWEPLGITVVMDRNPAAVSAEASRPVGLRGLTVELKNHGSTPQAIVHGPALQTLRLVPALDRWRTVDQASWAWVGENVAAEKPSASDVKLLQPGESHRVHLDFTSPEWFARKKDGNKEPGPAVSLETLTREWTASFRIEYAPPSAADCIGLPAAELIRHSRLRSRQFNATGAAD
jgi:hypothetical protein